MSENLDLLRRLDAWSEGENPGPLIRWAAAHLRGCEFEPVHDRLRHEHGIEVAARRYQSAEWAIRLAADRDEPVATDEHNARVEEWRSADRELRALLAVNTARSVPSGALSEPSTDPDRA
jgi:hypothetical protein